MELKSRIHVYRRTVYLELSLTDTRKHFYHCFGYTAIYLVAQYVLSLFYKRDN